MPFDFAQDGVRQANHESNRLIRLTPFALSLSECGVFEVPISHSKFIEWLSTIKSWGVANG